MNYVPLLLLGIPLTVIGGLIVRYREPLSTWADNAYRNGRRLPLRQPSSGAGPGTFLVVGVVVIAMGLFLVVMAVWVWVASVT